MRKIVLLLVVLLTGNILPAQKWAPTNIPPSARYDDVFFVNDSTGWAVGGDFKIYHTTNSGLDWQEQLSPKKYLRSVEFLTNKLGFCGSLDTSLYKTTDGGITWTDIASTISPRPVGFCGLDSPDSMTIYGCGIWHSPAYVIRSTNQGNTWTYMDMSAYASALVDVLFTSRDTGFAIGRAIAAADGGIILYTTNGGSSWQVLYKTNVPGDIVWKIQSPDKKHYFASVSANPSAGNTRILKSTDRGFNWTTLVIKPTFERLQVIGFIDSLQGWTGDDHIYETKDGGVSWQSILPNKSGFNRFFRVNDSVAYLAAGVVFKRTFQPAPPPVDPPVIEKHSLKAMPNPTPSIIKVEMEFSNNTFASLAIYTFNGRRISRLIHSPVGEGKKTVSFNLSSYAVGIYFVVLRTNEGLLYQKVEKK
jgi:photosystem II stability/assembly factor-like uncharacterized protein